MSKKQESNRPAFSSPLYAWLRQGLEETAKVLPAFPDSIQCVEEPGTLGNPTAQMVTEQMGTLSGYDRMLDAYASQGREENEKEQELER